MPLNFLQRRTKISKARDPEPPFPPFSFSGDGDEDTTATNQTGAEVSCTCQGDLCWAKMFGNSGYDGCFEA